MSVYSFAQPVQAAVYADLTGDAALMAVVTGVYDLVPVDAVCPYLALTVERAAPFRTKTRRGERITLAVTVVSAEAGAREAQELSAAVVRVLSEGMLTVSGAALVLLVPQAVTLAFEENSRKVTARIGFEITVQEAL